MLIEIVPYQPSWPTQFLHLATALKLLLNQHALAIHHIGSTSVPGLAAKNVIDIQVSVREFNAEIIGLLLSAGYKHLPHITNDHHPAGRPPIPEHELNKLFFQKNDPDVNLHVRIDGYYNQRFPLLCRDYLRAHPAAAKPYELIKKNLAHHFPRDLNAYYQVKDPVFDIIMAGAETWAEMVKWKPGPSDV